MLLDMTALLVVGGLLTLLAVACWWEARSGRPAWGAHLPPHESPTAGGAAAAAKKGVASSLALGAIHAADGGDG